MKSQRKTRDVARVRVPESQPPFAFLPGKAGGWFVSVLWNYGSGLDVRWPELRRLLGGSEGDVLVARRLEGDELALFDSYRDIAHEIHARMIFKPDHRWRRPRRRKRRR